MNLLELLIPYTPVSAQTKSRKTLQAWKRYVRSEAARVWAGRPAIESGAIRLTLVYLYDEDPLDTDNIIKPIQNALEGPVLVSDILVADVESYRRHLAARFDTNRLPTLLAAGLALARDCAYVSVRPARNLEESL